MTKTKNHLLRMPPDLFRRIEKQRKKENRSRDAFIRRVLDRYLLEQEFRTPNTKVGADVIEAASDSAERNQELHKLLRNS
jgi:metal-responsive CopG/Arc/MetJ family transcriptional regulator